MKTSEKRTLGFSFSSFLQFPPNSLIGGYFRRPFRALDHEGDDLVTIHLGERALLGIAVLHLAEIGELGEPAAGKSDLRL